MNTETGSLAEYLARIARGSINGEIDWTQPNPSSFQWTKLSKVVSIQKAVNPRLAGLLNSGELESTYLFQVHDRDHRRIVVSISSKDRPEFKRVLEAIYRGAEQGMDMRASSVLRQLLDE